jgi:hypothetical protein
MTLKSLLKRSQSHGGERQAHGDAAAAEDVPAITFVRTDTHTPEATEPPPSGSSTPDRIKTLSVKRLSRFRSPSTASLSSADSQGKKRLSSLLHLRRGSHDPTGSANIPTDLPDINDSHDGLEKEAQWEKRATMLARSSTTAKRQPSGPKKPAVVEDQAVPNGRPSNERAISDANGDVGSSVVRGRHDGLI